MDQIWPAVIAFLSSVLTSTVLAKRLFEHQTRFAKLHEQRAEVVAKTYALLSDMQSEVWMTIPDMSQPPESEADQYRKMRDAIRAFLIYFAHNRLYFSKSLADKIDAFKRRNLNVVRKHGQVKGNAALPMPIEEKIKIDTEIQNAIDEELPQLFAAIEKRFRKMLGVSDKD